MSHAAARPTVRKGIQCAFLFTVCMLLSCLPAESALADVGGSGSIAKQQGVQHMKIRIAIGSTTMTAILDDNPTARDFAAMLPLKLTLRDFGSAEKVSDALSRPLSEQGAPATAAGAVGEIAYYAPWRNIAFYRGNVPDAAGVIRIARITAGIEALELQGRIQVSITRAD